MNIKRVVKYLELKSQLTAEELQMAETMVGLTESDKEALAGLLQPVKVKGKPTTTKRVIEKCATEGCGLTRRAQVHKDTNADGYHVFSDPHGARKSARAESLAGAIKKKSGDKEPRCVACYEITTHPNHDLADGGHEFTADLVGRVNAVLDKHDEPEVGGFADDTDMQRCAHNYGDELCGEFADANVHHLKTATNYHEFVASETAVGVGGD